MAVKFEQKFVRSSAQKMRLVADQIRGLDSDRALMLLKMSPKKPAGILAKLIQSSLTSAEKDFSMDPSNVYISRIEIGEGPVLKRFRPRAQGRAAGIRKRTSHVFLTLGERGL